MKKRKAAKKKSPKKGAKVSIHSDGTKTISMDDVEQELMGLSKKELVHNYMDALLLINSKAKIIQSYKDKDKETKDKNVLSMRKASGEYKSEDLLVAFLYILMRDSVVPGKVEAMILELTNEHDKDTPIVDPYTFTNGWLAQYAEFVAKRLKDNVRTLSDVENHRFSNRFNR